MYTVFIILFLFGLLTLGACTELFFFSTHFGGLHLVYFFECSCWGLSLSLFFEYSLWGLALSLFFEYSLWGLALGIFFWVLTLGACSLYIFLSTHFGGLHSVYFFWVLTLGACTLYIFLSTHFGGLHSLYFFEYSLWGLALNIFFWGLTLGDCTQYIFLRTHFGGLHSVYLSTHFGGLHSVSLLGKGMLFISCCFFWLTWASNWACFSMNDLSLLSSGRFSSVTRDSSVGILFSLEQVKIRTSTATLCMIWRPAYFDQNKSYNPIWMFANNTTTSVVWIMNLISSKWWN